MRMAASDGPVMLRPNSKTPHVGAEPLLQNPSRSPFIIQKKAASRAAFLHYKR